MPGSQRSISTAQRARSVAYWSTAPSPAQSSRASISARPSRAAKRSLEQRASRRCESLAPPMSSTRRRTGFPSRSPIPVLARRRGRAARATRSSASSTPSILRYTATWEPNAASLAVPHPRRRPVDQHANPRPVPRPSSVLEALRGPDPRFAGRSSAPMSPSASGAAPWGTLPSRHGRRLKAVVARLFAFSVGGVSASGCERSKGGVGQRRAESGRGVGSCCPPDRARGRLGWVAGPGPAVSRPSHRRHLHRQLCTTSNRQSLALTTSTVMVCRDSSSRARS